VETVETVSRVLRLKFPWLKPGVNEIPPSLRHYKKATAKHGWLMKVKSRALAD
jgi:hypothetical protein